MSEVLINTLKNYGIEYNITRQIIYISLTNNFITSGFFLEINF
jgi:hypothetical protein